MLFNSYAFLLFFLPIVLVGWWLLRRTEHRLAFLAAASVFFYAWWDWRYVPLLLGLVAVDYLAGRELSRTPDGQRRKAVLTAAIAGNVGALAGFKYMDLLASPVVLPLGLGFFTLNGISYLVDVYRRQVQAAQGPVEFTAFLAMFPHLIAGPIIRYVEIGPQFLRLPHRLDGELASRGATLIALGLAKKLLIADELAPTVDGYFDSAGTLTFTSGWAAAVGYTLQLYFDFSAYSDIAIGLALLLGIRFPQNFDSPLQARDIADFWRRWHITLSRWIRDYFYIPLGGSRGSLARTARNLFIAMLLGGLWHGAGLTFAVWGIYHGVLLGGHALWRRRGLSLGATTGRLLTFGAVVTGFVIFRAPDMQTAASVFKGMFGMNGLTGGADVTVSFALVLTALLAIVNVAPNSWQLAFTPRLRPAIAVSCGVMAALAFLQLSQPTPFLYFRF